MEQGQDRGFTAGEMEGRDDVESCSLSLSYFPPCWAVLPDPEKEVPEACLMQDVFKKEERGDVMSNEEMGLDVMSCWKEEEIPEDVMNWKLEEEMGSEVMCWKEEEEVSRMEDVVREEEQYMDFPCGATSAKVGTITRGTLRVYASSDVSVLCECGQGNCKRDQPITPQEFERHANRESSKKWKCSIWVVDYVKGGKLVPVEDLKKDPNGDPRINWLVSHLPSKKKKRSAS